MTGSAPSSLGSTRATSYGCSSGGAAVLDLLLGHRDLARNGIVHEVAILHAAALATPSPLLGLLALDDDAIASASASASAYAYASATMMNEDDFAWKKTQVAPFFSNIVLCARAGIELGMLPCKHFPQVSIPDQLAAHIRASTRPYL